MVFLLTPRLLHLLGPERFGILMILLVTPVIATQFDFGLALSAVRRLAADLRQGQIDGSGILFSYALGFLRDRIAVRHASWRVHRDGLRIGWASPRLLGARSGARADSVVRAVGCCESWLQPCRLLSRAQRNPLLC